MVNYLVSKSVCIIVLKKNSIDEEIGEYTTTEYRASFLRSLLKIKRYAAIIQFLNIGYTL